MQLQEVVSKQEGVYSFTLTANEAELAQAAQKAYEATKASQPVSNGEAGVATREEIEAKEGELYFYFDAVNQLLDAQVDDLLAQGFAQENLMPLSAPSYDLSYCEKDGATVIVTLAVLPEVTLGEYKGLTAEYDKVSLPADAVEREIENLRQRAATVVPHDGAAVLGDIVTMDYCGKIDGVAFEGGTAKDAKLELGGGQFIPGFEEQLVGHSAGETFDIDVVFPEPYGMPEYAGKAAVFTITLHENATHVVPALTDEFVSKICNLTTVSALREQMQNSMNKHMDAQARQQAQFVLLGKIGENSKMNLPQLLIAEEYNDGMRNLNAYLQNRGMPMQAYLMQIGKTQEEFEVENRDAAKNALRGKLAAYAIAQKEGIVITEEALTAEVARIAAQQKMPVEAFKAQTPAYKVKNQMILFKTLVFVAEHATLTAVTR